MSTTTPPPAIAGLIAMKMTLQRRRVRTPNVNMARSQSRVILYLRCGCVESLMVRQSVGCRSIDFIILYPSTAAAVSLDPHSVFHLIENIRKQFSCLQRRTGNKKCQQRPKMMTRAGMEGDANAGNTNNNNTEKWTRAISKLMSVFVNNLLLHEISAYQQSRAWGG